MNKEKSIKLLIEVANKAIEKGITTAEESLLINEAISVLELQEMEVQGEIIDIQTTQEIGGGVLISPRINGGKPPKK